MPVRILLAVACCLCSALSVRAAGPITLESLLHEMIDRDAIARFPDPPYTCRQFSSYDRASTSPSDEKTWFANGDVNQFLRTEDVPSAGGTPRKEWVMMDTDGPGAIVRFWSANPPDGSTIRIYIDNAPTPALEAPFQALLNGRWKIAEPLSAITSRGWNLYLPIPYASHCKVTCDKDGFYYQLNYRTYAPGTSVQPFTMSALTAANNLIGEVQTSLADPMKDHEGPITEVEATILEPGQSKTVTLPAGPLAIKYLAGYVRTNESGSLAKERLYRSVIIQMEFDGEKTVWCPVGDFYGSGVGHNKFKDWYRMVHIGDYLHCAWVMPYKQSAKITLSNIGKSNTTIRLRCITKPFKWDDRSMHFHAAWHDEYPIHALGGRGTKDWNYIQITGKGVYAGDTLAVMNPVKEWWGEGDEKIYVDGETFPSHFGTGTEDYYGYAWCDPETFAAPFHAQPRVDGQAGKNNYGHTTVTRTRSLDAIPFTKSFKFDMEIWHWKECDEEYAATTYFYALPGATTNRPEQPDAASRDIIQPPPLPPPLRIAGAIECEKLKVVSKSDGAEVGPQDGFGDQLWSAGAQLWIRAKAPGDFVEIEVPAPAALEGKEVKVTLYATRSWDYGVVRFTVNGQKAGPDIDLYNTKGHDVASTGPLDLGTAAVKGGKLLLRAELVGANPKSEGTKSFFGLDCIVLTPVP